VNDYFELEIGHFQKHFWLFTQPQFQCRWDP